MARNCPKPCNPARAAARKLKSLHKKKTANSVHVVLAHLSHRLDVGMDTSSDTKDATIFKGLVSTLDTSEKNENAEILALKIASEACGSQKFEGECVDSGAQQSVIGKNQGEFYCNVLEKNVRVRDPKPHTDSVIWSSIALACCT